MNFSKLLEEYSKIIELSENTQMQETLMLTIKQLYKLSQFNAVHLLDQTYQKHFQILALLCKKYLRDNLNKKNILEYIQMISVQNLRTQQIFRIEGEFHVGYLGLCRNRSAHIYINKEENRVYLLELESEPQLFTVAVQECIAMVDKVFVINEIEFKILRISDNIVTIGFEDRVIDLRNGETVGDTQAVVSNKTGEWKINGKMIFVFLEKIYTDPNENNWRFEAVIDIFRIDSELFRIF